MAKLGHVSRSEVTKLLEEHGFAEARRKGSHVVLQRIADAGTVAVVVPDHKVVRIGTLRSIR